jgi:TRAP-type C4-dicarboxylate transport system permease small subunit
MSEHGRPGGEAAAPASGLAHFADSFEAVLGKIYRPIGWVGAATLAFVVVMMVWSVIGRRFFNAPLEGASDIQEMGLLVMTMTVLGVEHLGHEKMTVNLLTKRFSKPVNRVINIVIYCVAIVILAIAVWQLLVWAGALFERGETTPGVLALPKYIFAYLSAFGVFTLIPIYVARLLRAVGGVVVQ